MKKKITKVELLHTYLCPLSCKFCNMKRQGETNSRSLEDWRIGVDNWKRLGADFVAIYGAEPLADFNKLPGIVQLIAEAGIESTVITSGAVKDFHKKLIKLNDHGLRSLTMSYDIVAYDKYSKEKMHNAIDSLQFFQKLTNIRDTAAVVTVTNDNIDHLSKAIEMLSKLGIWTFTDLAHWDKGNLGTKCKSGKSPLHVTDVGKFKKVFEKVLRMKEDGYLVHTNDVVVNEIVFNKLNYTWNCANYKVFPSWITVDPNGIVYPCDDFKPNYIGRPYDMTNIFKEWDNFSDYWRGIVKTACRGCSWMTHIGSHQIKGGVSSIKDYVHGDWKAL